MKLIPCDWSNPDAVALREAQRVDIEERYGTPDSEPGPAPTADDITAFFLLRDGDVALSLRRPAATTPTATTPSASPRTSSPLRFTRRTW